MDKSKEKQSNSEQ